MILAELFIDGKSVGPHLFWAPIQTRLRGGGMKAVKGVTVTALPDKIALKSLDNAYIQFDQFVVPRGALLSRFCSVDAGGGYKLALPAGSKRMLVRRLPWLGLDGF